MQKIHSGSDLNPLQFAVPDTVVYCRLCDMKQRTDFVGPLRRPDQAYHIYGSNGPCLFLLLILFSLTGQLKAQVTCTPVFNNDTS